MTGYKTRSCCGRVSGGLLLAAVFVAPGHWSKAAEPLATLDQSLSQAMEKNPGIIAAKAKIAMAQAELSSTQLEVARQVIVLWGNWETQRNEAAAARRALERLKSAQRNATGTVAGVVVEQAGGALVDAEAKLSRTQTELRYLTGQVNLQGGKGAVKPADQGIAPPVARKTQDGSAGGPTEATLQMVHGLTAEKVRQVLAMPAEFHFQAVPLGDVLASLADKYQVDIRLDKKALGEAGVRSDTPITASLKNMTLKAALSALFLDTRLAWVVQDGVLLITTRDRAENMLVTVIYPVLDLLPPPPKTTTKQVSGAAVGVAGPGYLGGATTGRTDNATSNMAAGQGRAARGPTRFESALGDWDSLTELLTSVVQPTTWDSVGGLGSIAPFENRGVLIVSQTEEIHTQIAELLDLLRKGAAVAPESASGGVQSDSYRRIPEALDLPVQLSSGKKPLAEVLAILEQNCKIPIRLDKKALEREGIDPGATVTAEIKGASLRSALRLLLHDLELTYTIAAESLLVTTPEAAEAHLPVVVYPVGDLVTNAGPAGQTAIDFDALIEMLTSTIQPVNWDSVGGPGSIAPYEKGNLLAVRQSVEVQEEIGRMLKGLRQYPTPKLPTPKP